MTAPLELECHVPPWPCNPERVQKGKKIKKRSAGKEEAKFTPKRWKS